MELQSIYSPYINEVLCRQLIKSAENSGFDKAGGNSKCAIIDNYAVLKTGNIPGHNNEFVQVIEALQDLRADNVNVVPILGYAIVEEGEPYKSGARYDKGYIIQAKAMGKELLYPAMIRNKTDEEKTSIVGDYLQLLHSIPQEHYDKWVADYKAITDKGIMVDASKESNFFYDENIGFSFIDLNFVASPEFNRLDENGEIDRSNFITHTFVPFLRILRGQYDNFYSPQELKQIARESFVKNVNALLKLGITKVEIDKAVERGCFPADLCSLDNLNDFDINI